MTKPTAQELKPCPFCGRECAIQSAGFYGHEHFTAGCGWCRIVTPVMGSKENAASRWNARVAPSKKLEGEANDD